jgi:hypothetical protein
MSSQPDSPDSTKAAVFVDPPKLSTKIPRSAQHGKRSFSTRADYEQSLAPEDPASIWKDPSLVAAIARHWHRQGQTGCLFAKRLADEATARRWGSAVITGSTAAQLRQSVSRAAAQALDQGIADPGCEIVSLLFPDVVDVTSLKAACSALEECTPITRSDDRSHADAVIVALRLDVTGSGCLAWIMAFGPFASWPPTRQGPVLEIVVRTKAKPQNLFHKLNQDPAAAHLADTSLSYSLQKMEQVFERTEKTTRDVLGHAPDHRSAAKATFSFAPAEWDEQA